MYDKKEMFVNKHLNDTIANAFTWVDSIEYLGGEEGETVIIWCKNGYQYCVNVYGDSMGAIIEDVVTECLRH